MKGKKKAGKGGANSTFTVKEVSKDYGAASPPQSRKAALAVVAPASRV